ncbi:MAG: GNAT family N-acetyltransferase [Candidatus Bipolaricaulis sp.]|nr:GNAT family N-acetyltransferase [Candidatus Bipolaricaulis sp.]
MVVLRKSTQEEFDRWFALSMERQAEDRAWVNGTDPKAERAQLEAMIPVLLPKGMDSPDHAFRVARDEAGNELGFVWVGVAPGAPEGTCVLFDVHVHEAHRGRGVARAMLEQMLESLKGDAIKTVVLYVRADNAPARALYTKLGFVEEETPEGAKDLQMRKTLEPDPEDERAHTFERQHVVVSGLPSTRAILDIGGGGEGVIGRIAGERVIAIDRLRQELEEAPAGPLKIVMDARELGFLDKSFQTVTAFFSLMYMKAEDHPRVFEEAFRVLAPGGRFLVWDAVIPPRTGEKRDIVVFPMTIDLPDGKVVSTGYGVRWPDGGRDAAYYRHVAEAAQFEVVSEHATERHFAMELAKR